MAPRLCSVCAIVPHWLSSLPWDDFLYYDETTITLRSWRGMLEQAEAAEAAEASRAAAAGTTGTATGTAEKKRRKSGSERRTGVEEYAVGRSGEELQGKTEGEGKSEEGGGCDLCLMITKAANCRRNYDRPYYMPPPPAMDPRHNERYLDVPLVFGREGEKVIGMDVKGRDDYWEYKIVCLSNRELFAVKVVSVPGSWCPKFQPPMRYGDQNPENNILLMKDWLDNCRRNHTKCCEIKKTMGTTGTNFLPSRLLDVQAFQMDSKSSYLGEDVRLVSSSPPMGQELDMDKFPPPYFTLSHCWGPPEKRPATTTKANLAQRMQRIPFLELPRTFQDAIEITRKLGYRYLWIDSLCIVQDDEQDWAHEAGLMAKVYSHSSCTLSALSSKDSSEGLHLEPLSEGRSYMDLMTPSHAYPAGDGDNDSGSVKSYMDDPFPFRFRLFYSLDNWQMLYNGKALDGLCDDISPLRSRAWTLQERELSRRIIHYAKNQMLWECAELEAMAQRPWHNCAYRGLDPEQEWEEWEEITKSQQSTNLLQDCDGNLQVTPAAVTASSLLSAYQSEREWWKMVLDYSQRVLSQDTDKLTALSGMAQFYQRNHFPQARYVAGMWSSRLEDELFWYVQDKVDARRPTAGYVAPSWSWASVNGRVTFGPMDPVRRFKSMRKKMPAVAAETVPTNAEVEDRDVKAKEKDKDKDREREGERDTQKVICEEWKIEEINLSPKYDDPYGALKGANLIIGGARLVEVNLFTETMIEPAPEYIGGVHRYYGGLKIDGRWVADHRLDIPGEADQDGCRLVCLGMLAERVFGERPTIGGLLLREEKLDVDGGFCVYSRVGRFQDMAVALFDGVESRRIKLI